ncbi:uncharacterized protein BJX67DRAFT_308726 [Aspergillus lucknowensis]|uniref:Uncharacterized protein n=1 Tax=Aspergillus lucknowensis TaxID=176173 RepID=A0ABR4M0M2_9EURO
MGDWIMAQHYFGYAGCAVCICLHLTPLLLCELKMCRANESLASVPVKSCMGASKISTGHSVYLRDETGQHGHDTQLKTQLLRERLWVWDGTISGRSLRFFDRGRMINIIRVYYDDNYLFYFLFFYYFFFFSFSKRKLISSSQETNSEAKRYRAQSKQKGQFVPPPGRSHSFIHKPSILLHHPSAVLFPSRRCRSCLSFPTPATLFCSSHSSSFRFLFHFPICPFLTLFRLHLILLESLSFLFLLSLVFLLLPLVFP